MNTSTSTSHLRVRVWCTLLCSYLVSKFIKYFISAIPNIQQNRTEKESWEKVKREIRKPSLRKWNVPLFVFIWFISREFYRRKLIFLHIQEANQMHKWNLICALIFDYINQHNAVKCLCTMIGNKWIKLMDAFQCENIFGSKSASIEYELYFFYWYLLSHFITSTHKCLTKSCNQFHE